MKAPGTKRLKLNYNEPLSNFAFKFNLRRYTAEKRGAAERRAAEVSEIAALKSSLAAAGPGGLGSPRHRK